MESKSDATMREIQHRVEVDHAAVAVVDPNQSVEIVVEVMIAIDESLGVWVEIVLQNEVDHDQDREVETETERGIHVQSLQKIIEQRGDARIREIVRDQVIEDVIDRMREAGNERDKSRKVKKEAVRRRLVIGMFSVFYQVAQCLYDFALDSDQRVVQEAEAKDILTRDHQVLIERIWIVEAVVAQDRIHQSQRREQMEIRRWKRVANGISIQRMILRMRMMWICIDEAIRDVHDHDHEVDHRGMKKEESGVCHAVDRDQSHRSEVRREIMIESEVWVEVVV